MIELDDYDYKLIKEIGGKQFKDYKFFDLDDKHYITKDELIGALENTYDDYLYLEERLVETSDKLDEVWKEKQGSWYDSYVFMKMKYEELEEKLETIKSTLNEDDYDKLNERGVEL